MWTYSSSPSLVQLGTGFDIGASRRTHGPTQADVDQAMAVARGCRVAGSTNKWYEVSPNWGRTAVNAEGFQKLLKAATRQANARAAVGLVNGLRAVEPANNAPVQDWLNHAEAIKKTGAGNCAELSLVAFAELHRLRVRPLYWVYLSKPGDHAFTIAGYPGVPYDSNHGWGRDLSRWGHGVWVVDPWANIGCKAAQYKAAWAAKMNKWGAAGKQVSYQRQYIDPRRADWYGAIGSCDILWNGLQAV
jgi:hypothetical protein